MVIYKTYDNGLRLVVNKIEGLTSVSLGVLVKTGSVNETKEENGISHYLEHVMFKGTETRTAFSSRKGATPLQTLRMGKEGLAITTRGQPDAQA